LAGARGEPLVRADALTKVHAPGSPRAVRALDGVSLTIERGDYVAIVGESGSGKSTLMQLLGGLDRPTSGTIAIDGARLDRASRDDLARIRARTIGFVFQGFNLIPSLDALDNVALAARYARRDRGAARERARSLLAGLGLGGRLHHRPLELSGGQQQRVAIARALINEPALLLADEPTGELDSHTADAILDVFDALHAAGQTIVVVTHSPAVERRARRVVRLADGAVVADAP
jgi:ABC-type lipoprotein export system ATPase subunit